MDRNAGDDNLKNEAGQPRFTALLLLFYRGNAALVMYSLSVNAALKKKTSDTNLKLKRRRGFLKEAWQELLKWVGTGLYQ